MTESVRIPRVSVLMPVFNGAAHLGEAIESILRQSFDDFEFLIVNDGSTDASAEIAASYPDPRIRLVENDGNRGLIYTLNRGLDLARGEYVARMDCDDISLRDRLGKQVAYLDSHPRVGICGTWFRKFGAGKEKTVFWNTDPESIRCGLLFNAMVGHPTVMLRRVLFEKFGLRYAPQFKNAEDFELWVRAARHCDLANLPEVLLRYRVHPGQVTQQHAGGQRGSAAKVRLAQVELLGIVPSEQEVEIHEAVATCCCAGIEELHARAEAWLCRLKHANDQARLFPEPAFSRELVERWLVLCKKGAGQGFFSLKTLYFPDLLRQTAVGRGFVLKYLLRQLANR